MEPYTYSPLEEDPVIEPRPIWQSRVLWVAVAAFIVVPIVLFVWLFARESQEDEQTARGVRETQERVQRCAHDGCKRAEVRAAATEFGAVQVCDLLEGADRDGCVWSVALRNDNADTCAGVQDQNKRERCQDAVFHERALRLRDVNACSEIREERGREACVQTLLGPVTSTNCSARGYDEAYCASLQLIERAGVAKDPDVCNGVSSEELKAECLERVGVPDRDGDGLNETAEDEYGTSDRKADSDGDGFGDAEEIEAGYNPAGPGRL